MRIVRGIFSGIFSFVLVIVLVILGIAITINHTILNPNFVISELDKLDVYSLVVEQIRNQVTSQLPEQEPYVAQVVDETLTDLQPWLREQARTVIYSGYAYLKGEEGLNIVISLEEVKASLKENLAQAIRESLPPELAGVPQSQIDAFISQACAEIDSQIPNQIEVNEALLGPEIVTPLQKAREIIGYIELGYKVSIGLSALLILIIALIQWWRAKPIARYIGISFTVAGVISLVGSIAARSLVSHAIQLEIPPDISAKLPQLISDFTGPLQIYSLVLLIVGIALIVLSIKLKSSDAESL
jgi:hypothetical protein